MNREINTILEQVRLELTEGWKDKVDHPPRDEPGDVGERPFAAYFKSLGLGRLYHRYIDIYVRRYMDDLSADYKMVSAAYMGKAMAEALYYLVSMEIVAWNASPEDLMDAVFDSALGRVATVRKTKADRDMERRYRLQFASFPPGEDVSWEDKLGEPPKIGFAPDKVRPRPFYAYFKRAGLYDLFEKYRAIYNRKERGDLEQRRLPDPHMLSVGHWAAAMAQAAYKLVTKGDLSAGEVSADVLMKRAGEDALRTLYDWAGGGGGRQLPVIGRYR